MTDGNIYAELGIEELKVKAYDTMKQMNEVQKHFAELQGIAGRIEAEIKKRETADTPDA